jgi:hypothetical protein
MALATLAAAGCAAISGLDGITEQACAPDCDAGATGDSTVVGPDGAPTTGATDSPATDDTTLPEDALPPTDDAPTRVDSQPPSDAEPTPDASDAGEPDGSSTDGGGADTGPADASVKDAGHEAGGTDAGQADSGSDAGCGPTTTVDNCSACGDKCVTTGASSAGCTGTTCTYTCGSGHLDCNASTAPDLDGCECNVTGAAAAPAPACCAGGSCPQLHHYDEDLLNSNFYDCVAAGAFNITVATDACTAFTGDATQCDNGGFVFYCDYPDGGLAGDMVCSNGAGATNCNCWGYNGAIKGWMSTGTGKGQANCVCPQPGATLWN